MISTARRRNRAGPILLAQNRPCARGRPSRPTGATPTSAARPRAASSQRFLPERQGTAPQGWNKKVSAASSRTVPPSTAKGQRVILVAEGRGAALPGRLARRCGCAPLPASPLEAARWSGQCGIRDHRSGRCRERRIRSHRSAGPCPLQTRSDKRRRVEIDMDNQRALY